MMSRACGQSAVINFSNVYLCVSIGVPGKTVTTAGLGVRPWLGGGVENLGGEGDEGRRKGALI